MKRKIIFIVVLLCAVAVAIVGYTQSSKSSPETSSASSSRAAQRQQRHIEREQRRAERQAAYERYIDSIVLARNFQFSPQTMQQQVAGGVRILNNPDFGVQVWGSEVDIFLPYIKGVTAPYYTVMLNYALPHVAGYTTEQTRRAQGFGGW